MVTLKSLKDSGYVNYEIYPSVLRSLKSADLFFQKRIINSEGQTKYFVEVYYYDFQKYPGGVESFLYEVVFYDSEERKVTISVSNRNFESIQQVEEYFEKLFKVNEFILNPHN